MLHCPSFYSVSSNAFLIWEVLWLITLYNVQTHTRIYTHCTIKSDLCATGFNDIVSLIFSPLRGYICTDLYYYRGQNYKLEPVLFIYNTYSDDWGLILLPLSQFRVSFSFLHLFCTLDNNMQVLTGFCWGVKKHKPCLHAGGFSSGKKRQFCWFASARQVFVLSALFSCSSLIPK